VNAHSKIARTAALFKSNRNQAVRLPKDFTFPDDVDKVLIRRVGKSILLTPPNAFWDDFFDRLPADDDFVEPEELPLEPIEEF
jgi:antitoxin VapB